VAAQEAVEAFRVNEQIKWVGVYGRTGQVIAGYGRPGDEVPATIAAIPPPAPRAVRVLSAIGPPGQHIGSVYLEIDREASSRRLTRYTTLFGFFLLAALVVASLGFAQAQLRRVNRELANRAKALAEANSLLEVQIGERTKAEDQLRQSQKMQALGQLTGGIAHDFNNLLTVIQGSADMLCRPGLTEPKRARFAQAIVQAAGNAASLTSQLLAFARRQPLKPEQVSLNELILEMRDLIDRTMGELIRVTTELCETTCRVQVDRTQLQSAILNVATNAQQAMPNGGQFTIRTSERLSVSGSRMIAIEMSDDGKGMDAQTMDRIFEPFFTTKETGKGTGLGLSQVYGFASQSGGEALVESEPGRGTTLTLLLPCTEGPGVPETAAVRDQLPDQSPAVILIVEDHEEVGAFAETMLSELGHQVTRARSGEEALALCRGRSFDLVLSDVVMPGMGGLKLAETLAVEQPELPVVLATGYSQEIAESGSGGRPVILKPYRLAALSEALTMALRQRRDPLPQNSSS
jgi:signal transduction histidine kinase/CheY-like chemotaxis protein